MNEYKEIEKLKEALLENESNLILALQEKLIDHNIYKKIESNYENALAYYANYDQVENVVYFDDEGQISKLDKYEEEALLELLSMDFNIYYNKDGGYFYYISMDDIFLYDGYALCHETNKTIKTEDEEDLIQAIKDHQDDIGVYAGIFRVNNRTCELTLVEA